MPNLNGFGPNSVLDYVHGIPETIAAWKSYDCNGHSLTLFKDFDFEVFHDRIGQ